MYFNGINVTKVSSLGWRDANPETDIDLYGLPYNKNECAVVRIKDCRIYEKGDRRHYDPEDAPAIPMVPTGTHYGYGKCKVRNRRIIDVSSGRLYERYFTTPFYVVKGGYVYRGYVHSPTPSLAYFKARGYTHNQAVALRLEYLNAIDEGCYMEVELP